MPSLVNGASVSLVGLEMRLIGVVAGSLTLSGKAALMRDRLFGVRGPVDEASTMFASLAVFAGTVYFLVAIGVVSAGEMAVMLDMVLSLVALGVAEDG